MDYLLVSPFSHNTGKLMKDFFEGMFWVILILGIIKFIVSYPAYLRKKKNDDAIDEKNQQ